MLSEHAHLSNDLHNFFLSWYYRHDTITRFINSLLQGLSISQCDGLMHIILTLTSGALHPSHQEIYRDTKTQLFSLSQRESAFLSHILCCLSLSLSGTQQAFLTKESKKVFDLHPHLVSACISLSSLTFLPETKMSEGRWMGYLFSSQSSKSSEKHQSPFKLSTILSRSRSRAQKCTTAYGSHIRSRIWGPLHLLVELRAQAENMMVICIVGPLSSPSTCSHKCLLLLLFLLLESLLRQLGFAGLSSFLLFLLFSLVCQDPPPKANIHGKGLNLLGSTLNLACL